MNKQIKSKQRVRDFGEVYTPPEIVNAMLDLVKQETERIDSRNIIEAMRKRKIRNGREGIIKKPFG